MTPPPGASSPCPSSGAVAIGRAPTAALDTLAEQVRSVARSEDEEGRRPDLAAALELARQVGADASAAGEDGWRRPWEVLATLGAGDLTVARVVEPHLDALSILEQAQASGLLTADDVSADGVWGVYAAEGGPARLRASRDDGGAWRLDGAKPWCSLADRADRALVTAWVDDDRRGLFAIDLGAPGVRAAGEPRGSPAVCPRSAAPASTSTRSRPLPSAHPGGTSTGRASRGAGSASPRSGTAPPSPSPVACAPPPWPAPPTSSPWRTWAAWTRPCGAPQRCSPRPSR